MEIGIIGAGNIGSILAGYLTQLGHQILIANSRGPESLKQVAEETGAKASTLEQAASAQDIVIIAIPAKAWTKLPKNILSASKAIIIDSGNYYPSRDGRNIDIEQGLTDSEWTAKTIGHPVIKAFNNIVAPSLASKALPAGNADRIAISAAGDDQNEKNIVLELIDNIGFDAVDSGSLAESWRQQPGEPAYCQDLDKNSLKKALQQADYSKRAANLAEADEIARPYL